MLESYHKKLALCGTRMGRAHVAPGFLDGNTLSLG
jgi:hypothetical protein